MTKTTTAARAWVRSAGGALAFLLLSACGSPSASRPDAADSSVPPPDGPADGGDSHQDVAPEVDAEAGVDAGDDADQLPTHGYLLPELPGGGTFYILLPPTFSPFLPLSGDEATREPPGFYDPSSAYYFSYGFLWWLTGTPDLSTAALRADLADYYTGLCRATTTAAAVTLDEPAPAAGTATVPDGGTLAARRHGTLTAGMCFNMPVPPAELDVSTYVCPDHTAVIVLVSPQPASNQVWTDLRGLRDAFSCW